MLSTIVLAQILSSSPPAVQRAEAQPVPGAPAVAQPGMPALPPEGAVPPAAQPAAQPAAPPATPKRYSYYGYHPVPDGHGTFCVVTGLHAHPFAPFDANLFVWWNGAWAFVGDPYDFGYRGGAYVYWHHHPHPWGGWCYFDDGHYHLYAAFGVGFGVYGAYYVWVGAYPTAYWHRHRHYTHYYRSVYAPRYRHGRAATRASAWGPLPGTTSGAPSGGVHAAPAAPSPAMKPRFVPRVRRR